MPVLSPARHRPHSRRSPSRRWPSRRRARADKSGWRASLRFVALFLLLAVALRSLVVMPRSIPSESMMPRLVVGDYLLVAKWPYGFSRFSPPLAPPWPPGRLFGRAPARGDVVVFRAPPAEREDYIKRVIGLPGDRVAMRGGRLWLNGRAVPRVRIADFVLPATPNTQCRSIAAPPLGLGIAVDGRLVCRFARYRETLPGGRRYETIDQGATMQDDTAPVTIPPGRYFMLGDNRDMSEDSRFPVAAGGIGLVPADNLEGRALVTFFSTGGGARWWNPATWLASTRFGRIGKGFG